MPELFSEDDMIRYLAGGCDRQERLEIESWLDADPDRKRNFDQLKTSWDYLGWVKDLDQIDDHSQWLKFRNQVKFVSDPKPSQFGAWPIAAAISFLLAVGGWWIWSHHPNLTEFRADNGISQFTLPDQTKLWLRDGSELVLIGDWQNSRGARLTGEGYFEVTHDKSRPFVITAGMAQVRVLGTSFGLRSSTDEIQLLLVEGSVSFSGPEDSVIISAGSRSTYRDGIFEISKSPNLNSLAWKTGRLEFKQTPFAQVVQDLQIFYQVTIRYDNSKLDECKLTAIFQDKSLDVVIDEIRFLLNLEVQTTEEMIELRGGGCVE